MKKEPIYLDGDRTAELNHGATTEQFLTLRQAVAAFHQLPPNRKETASIITVAMSYSSSDVERFDFSRGLELPIQVEDLNAENDE